MQKVCDIPSDGFVKQPSENDAWLQSTLQERNTTTLIVY